MKKLQKLLLLLVLLVAGVQSAWAHKHAAVVNVTIDRVTYECCHLYDTYSLPTTPTGESDPIQGSHVYYASVVSIAGNSLGDIVIPESINDGGQQYPVMYIGRHTSQQYNENADYVRVFTTVSINNNYIRNLTFKGVVTFEGDFTSNSCTSVEFQKDVILTANLSIPSATSIVSNTKMTIESTGILECTNAAELRFNTISHDGKIKSSSLRNIYYQKNLPAFSGAFSKYFTGVQGSQVTAHVYDKTEQKMEELRNSSVWADFNEIVNHIAQHEFTLKSNGGGEIKWVRFLEDNSSQIEYTMSGAGGQESVTILDNLDYYYLRIYFSGPITLLRNGVSVNPSLSNDGTYYSYREFSNAELESYEVIFGPPMHDVSLVLTAEACDKGIEVWSGETQVGSISQEGGTFWGEIENAQSLQLRVPNQYLEKIILNSTDVTATLPSTTPEDPAYAGYTFYTLADLSEFMVIEVQYSDNVPHPFETSEIRFDCLNGTGSLKIMKVWFEDGTYLSDNMGHLGINWLEMRTVSRIEVTMQPDLDNFTYAQEYNILGTIVNNGDGTYSYTIPGENLTSSIVPLYFPTSNYGSVKTLISSRNNIKLGYYFGELAIYDGGFLPQYAQENSSLQNSEVTIMHKNNAEPGWDVDQTKGIIYIQVPQGTTFRLVEDGVDHTADCVWYVAGQRLNEISNDYDFYMTPVAGYYYLLKNVTTDSYIVVDNGNGEIVSPWQVLQTIHVIGDGSLSLRKGGTEVESISEGEPTTVSWTTNDNLTLAVTLPDGANIDNYEAMLIIDGTSTSLQKVDGAFATFNMGSINTAHNIVLITRQVGGFASTGITWSAVAMGAQNYLFSVQYDGDPVIPNLDSENHVSFSSGQVTPEQVQDISGLYVMAEPGYTFDLTFNGINLNGVFGEGILRTINGKTYYEYQMTDAITDYKPILSTDGTWVVEFKKADLLTQHIQLTGEQLGSVWMQYLDSDGADYDDAYAGNEDPYVTFTSEEKIYIKGAKPCITVPDGYTFKVWFNGQEVTGFTLENNSYVVTLDESFITDGTWVVEVKKGITWTAVATGDVAEGMLDSGVESGVEIELNNQDDLELVEVMLSPSNTHNTGTFNFGVSDGDITPTQMHAWIYCKPRYELSSVTFNGVEYIESFDIQTSGVNSLYTLSLNISDDLSPFLVDGTWVVEFKKVEGITWNGMIIGDVPQGAVVDLGLDLMTMEVFLNAEETSASDTYTGSTEGVGMNADITVPTGYNFKVWFNGEEKSTIFTYDHTMSNGKKVYIYNSNENSQNAPYLQDGQWIILFYDDLERYDVNRDGHISIADVTTLVNKILGKD